MLVKIFLFCVSVFSLPLLAKPVQDFLPTNQEYLTSIPTPETVLGFELGKKYPRYHELVEYYQALAKVSGRLKITEIGKTFERRKQLLVTISAPNNLSHLDNILAARDLNVADKLDKNSPLVIWLSYSIHGDEASGASAAMALAYHLVASQTADMQELLNETIIVIEPTSNPDGLDRYSQWIESYSGLNANPDHIEHHQGWLAGRTNHFWFDLNRDLLVASQQETKNRLAYYQKYQPNVLADFHEMAPSKTYFFQPGVEKRVHPLTPKGNIELTQLLAKYHAKTLDQHQRLYFTEEAFDDFYYGKASSYPDINGAVGILFEQASSRGLQINTNNGLLTFEFAIENHLLTSLSTLAGATENREKLLSYRQRFYQDAEKDAEKETFDGYIIHEANDKYRLTSFLNILKQHQIKVYPLTTEFSVNNKIYPQQGSFYIPLAQKQYRMIKAIFSQQTEFSDNTFYDISGWTVPLAMNIKFYPVEKSRNLKVAEQAWQQDSFQPQILKDAYAYAFEWHHFLAPKLLNELLTEGIQVKAASQPFNVTINGQNKTFVSGTMLINAAQQKRKNWLATLNRLANENQIDVFSLASGLTEQGQDLGSSSMVNISPVNPLLIGGENISDYEAGEMVFYLQQQLNIPVTIVEESRLKNINLSRYSHLIMVDGNYNNLNEETVNSISSYVKNGGIIYAQKRAAKWLADKELLKVHFVPRMTIHKMFDTDILSYKDIETLNARKQISGAIFAAKLDLANPLTFGFADENLPLFKNSILIMDKPEIPFASIATYSKQPLLSGYTDQLVVNQVANSSGVVAHNVGAGKVIASTENLAFRGYWYGSAKLISNSLFFGKLIDPSIK